VVPLIWDVNLLVIALVVITGVTATNVFKQALLNPGIVPLDYVILASLTLLLWLPDNHSFCDALSSLELLGF